MAAVFFLFLIAALVEIKSGSLTRNIWRGSKSNVTLIKKCNIPTGGFISLSRRYCRRYCCPLSLDERGGEERLFSTDHYFAVLVVINVLCFSL